MKIIINGTPKEYSPPVNLMSLVSQFCPQPKHIITEVNGQIIASHDWAKTSLNEGDVVELVSFVGGG